jgi:hypothetical protein
LINKVYIQEYGNGKLEPEHKNVLELLTNKGITCELFTNKRLNRNQLLLNKETMVVGDHPTMQTIFKKLGLSVPNDCYPEVLHQFLGRKIWTTTIKQIFAQSFKAGIGNVFIKPKTKAKLFTGFVPNSEAELFFLNQFANDTELYCSSLVSWQAEYRVFVLKGQVIHTACYFGNYSIDLNYTVILAAIAAFESSPYKAVAYALDFGVTEKGETTFIEWNDAYALGGYDIDRIIN